MCFVQNKLQVEEIHFVGFLSKLLETRMMQVLRFKHGQVSIYFVGFLSICFILFFCLIRGLLICSRSILLRFQYFLEATNLQELVLFVVILA